MRRRITSPLRRVFTIGLAAQLLVAFSPAPASAATGAGVGNVLQGTQTDTAYAQSVQTNQVSNVDVTTQRVSCYRPEVPYATNNGPVDGYSGETACGNAATTGEATGAAGPYATQVGSNPGFPAPTPMLVKDHSESDIRVDPLDANHLIGSSKWVVSPEGYNHLLGFYESFDGGQSWPVQGHIPGYEGWTDDTDPVGVFDSFGNYYELNLAYQFFYSSGGTHNFSIGQAREPNPAEPAEIISLSVRPHGATTATNWITTHNGAPDIVKSYDSIGNEPDKQWITIDTNPSSPHFNRIYAMWVDFHTLTPVPVVAFADAHRDGTHTDWSAPTPLPMGSHHPQGATYLLPHVDPAGVVYTTLTNFNPKQGFCCVSILLDKSTDGGRTWSVASTVIQNVTPPPLTYPNTTFRDGIENTFGVGSKLVKGHYPLYVSWEDFSAGVDNVVLSASFDGGSNWSPQIQVNDNALPVDEFQPNLTVAADGTVSNAFYDRRLACPAASTAEAAGAGLQLDTVNPNYTGSLPPYEASNYCVNASVQYYTPMLIPIGHNVRLTQHTWDPQLNAPHPGCATCEGTFIGDYFGNITAGTRNFFTFVSTFDDGTNSANRQQQIVAALSIP
jgi:hypothetical protein